MHHSEQVNAGHRNRMRQKFILQGARPFLAHEILEMLLFSAIPYKDTNPLAHLLMDRFGSLDSVLEAPVDDLLSVPGMGILRPHFSASSMKWGVARFISL